MSEQSCRSFASLRVQKKLIALHSQQCGTRQMQLVCFFRANTIHNWNRANVKWNVFYDSLYSNTIHIPNKTIHTSFTSRAWNPRQSKRHSRIIAKSEPTRNAISHYNNHYYVRKLCVCARQSVNNSYEFWHCDRAGLELVEPRHLCRRFAHSQDREKETQSTANARASGGKLKTKLHNEPLFPRRNNAYDWFSFFICKCAACIGKFIHSCHQVGTWRANNEDGGKKCHRAAQTWKARDSRRITQIAIYRQRRWPFLPCSREARSFFRVARWSSVIIKYPRDEDGERGNDSCKSQSKGAGKSSLTCT